MSEYCQYGCNVRNCKRRRSMEVLLKAQDDLDAIAETKDCVAGVRCATTGSYSKGLIKHAYSDCVLEK